MKQTIEMTQEQKKILFEAANKLGDRLEDLFSQAVNNVAWQVSQQQANDPCNPIYDRMVRINECEVPAGAWKGVQQMRSLGLAEKSRASKGSGDEVNVLEAAWKAILEALVLLVQRLLGLATEHIPSVGDGKLLSEDEGPTL